MCFYILRLPICGHNPFPPRTRLPLLLHTFCRAFETELQRIHTDPAAWSTPAACLSIPFIDPPSCAPRWAPKHQGGNVFVQWRGFCGIECENSFLVPTPEVEAHEAAEESTEEREAQEGNSGGGDEGKEGNDKDLGMRRRRKLKIRRKRRGEKGAMFGVKREGIGWREG